VAVVGVATGVSGVVGVAATSTAGTAGTASSSRIPSLAFVSASTNSLLRQYFFALYSCRIATAFLF
jgi:hypothetical protein